MYSAKFGFFWEIITVFAVKESRKACSCNLGQMVPILHSCTARVSELWPKQWIQGVSRARVSAKDLGVKDMTPGYGK